MHRSIRHELYAGGGPPFLRRLVHRYQFVNMGADDPRVLNGDGIFARETTLIYIGAGIADGGDRLLETPFRSSIR